MNSKTKPLKKRSRSMEPTISIKKSKYYDLDTGKLIESSGIQFVSNLKPANLTRKSHHSDVKLAKLTGESSITGKKKLKKEIFKTAEIPLKISKFPSPTNTKSPKMRVKNPDDTNKAKKKRSKKDFKDVKIVKNLAIESPSRGRSLKKIAPASGQNMFRRESSFSKSKKSIVSMRETSLSRDRSISNSSRRSVASLDDKKTPRPVSTRFRQTSLSRERSQSKSRKKSTASFASTSGKSLSKEGDKKPTPKRESRPRIKNKIDEPSKPQTIINNNNLGKVEYKFRNTKSFEDETKTIISNACMLQLLDEIKLQSLLNPGSESIQKLVHMIHVNRSKAIEDAKKIMTGLKCDILDLDDKISHRPGTENKKESGSEETLIKVTTFNHETRRDVGTSSSSMSFLNNKSDRDLNLDDKLDEANVLLEKIENLLGHMKGDIKEKTSQYPWQKMDRYNNLLYELEETILKDSEEEEVKIEFKNDLKESDSMIVALEQTPSKNNILEDKFMEIFKKNSNYWQSSDEELALSSLNRNLSVAAIDKKFKTVNDGRKIMSYLDVLHSRLYFASKPNRGLSEEKPQKLVKEIEDATATETKTVHLSEESELLNTETKTVRFSEDSKSELKIETFPSERKDFVFEEPEKIILTRPVVSIVDQASTSAGEEETPPILIDLGEGKDVILELKRILEENRHKEIKKPLDKRKKSLKKSQDDTKEQRRFKPTIDIGQLRHEVMNKSMYSLFNSRSKLETIPEQNKVDNFGVSLLVREYVDEKFKELFLQKAETMLKKLKHKNESRDSVTGRIVKSILEKNLSNISNIYKM